MGRRKPPPPPEVEPLLRKAPSKEELIEGAQDAPIDTEETLRALQSVVRVRRAWTSEQGEHNLEYEDLRGLAAELLMNGPRYFIGSDGAKWVAVRRQSEKLEVDLDQLKELAPEIYDEVIVPKLDTDKFKRAVVSRDEQGDPRFPVDIFVKVTRFRPNAPYVDFIPADAGD